MDEAAPPKMLCCAINIKKGYVRIRHLFHHDTSHAVIFLQPYWAGRRLARHTLLRWAGLTFGDKRNSNTGLGLG